MEPNKTKMTPAGIETNRKPKCGVFQIRRVEFSELVFYEEAKGSFFIHGWAAQSSTAFPITVEKSSYHHLSQTEIGGDNPCSQHLSNISKIGNSLTKVCMSLLRIVGH